MSSPFKYAKKQSAPELAAQMARLKREQRELQDIIEKEPYNYDAKAALDVAQAQMSITRGAKSRRRDEGGRRRKRRTMKKSRHISKQKRIGSIEQAIV